MTKVKSGMRTGVAIGLAVSLSMGGFTAVSQGASASTRVATESASPSVRIDAYYIARVRCHIVKAGATVGYREGQDGGKTKSDAVKAAKKAVKVPKGHYKRHCRTLWVVPGEV